MLWHWPLCAISEKYSCFMYKGKLSLYTPNTIASHDTCKGLRKSCGMVNVIRYKGLTSGSGQPLYCDGVSGQPTALLWSLQLICKLKVWNIVLLSLAVHILWGVFSSCQIGVLCFVLYSFSHVLFFSYYITGLLLLVSIYICVCMILII